jgi:4-amino-4-deoxy-L-arabinose transferase-like glycosyltransferase
MKNRAARIGRFFDERGRILLVVVLSLAALALLAHALSAPYERAGPDGLKYERFGREAAASEHLFGCGNFGHAYWAPGWISTIGFLYRLFGPHYVVIRIFLIIAALLTALLVHRTALRLAGMRAALAAPVFFLFSSLTFRFTAYFQYELLLGCALFCSFTILFGWKAGTRDREVEPASHTARYLPRIVLGGALTGAAALISPRILVAIIPFGICFYLAGRARYLARALPAFLLGVAIVLAPWTYRNYRCFGEIIPTTSNGGINLYIANNPHSTGGYHMPPEDLLPDYERHDSGMWYREAFRYIAAHPLQTAGRMLKKGLVFWNPHYGDQAVLLFFLVLGLIRIKRGGGRFLSTGVFPLLAIPVAFTAVHMVFFVQPRYFIPVLPYVSIIAGIGLGGFKPDGSGAEEIAEHSKDIDGSGGQRHG